MNLLFHFVVFAQLLTLQFVDRFDSGILLSCSLIFAHDYVIRHILSLQILIVRECSVMEFYAMTDDYLWYLYVMISDVKYT